MHPTTKNRNLWLLSMILMAVIASCGKTSPPTPISAEVLKYFSYQPGTYWIYRDSLTGVEDSFYVSQVSSGDNNTGNAGGDYYVETSLITCAQNDSFNCMWQLYENYVEFTFGYPPISMYTSVWGFGIQFPYVDGGNVYTYYPSYTLYGNVYNNVTEYVDTNYLAVLSTNAGLIKMYIYFYSPDDTEKYIWELVRYNIVH